MAGRILGIYCIQRTDKPHELYIGSSIDVLSRFVQHKSSLRRGVHCNSRLGNLYNKHGGDVFEFVILETFEAIHVKALREVEQIYINLFIELYGREALLNLSLNTLSALDDPAVQEKRKAASLAAIKLRFSNPEELDKVRKAFVDMRSSEDFIKKHLVGVREAHNNPEIEGRRISAIKSWYASPENVEYITQKRKEICNRPEVKLKWSLAGKLRFADEDFVRKIIAASKVKISKPVTCLETGRVFSSISDAARYLRTVGHLKAYDSPIGACCKGSLKSCYGYHWHYSSEEYNHVRQARRTTGKQIMCVTTGLKFPSAIAAALFLRLNGYPTADNSYISKSCKTGKSVYGSRWEYVDN